MRGQQKFILKNYSEDSIISDKPTKNSKQGDLNPNQRTKEELNPSFYKSHGEEEYRRALKTLITKKDYLSPKFYKKALKERFFYRVAVIVNMELATGNHHSFLQVIESDRSFKFNNKNYIYDPEYRYYNIDLAMYCIDYHENITLPIKRHIRSYEIERQFNEDNIDLEYSLNPLLLEKFVSSKIQENILKGQEISEYIKRYGLMITIILFLVIIHLLLFAYKTGMFDQIRGSIGI